ncbi:tyrosine-protein phosphatase 10D-like [Palaemon carinicauda]|uniref:tyrosine-protein phosphatase 10D-like n=1 Tax=Palaemon carinicauda TaxID=392227 RepID=UPI0035B5DBAE
MEGPNAPGRFIMWYRNQTAILALWHRPHPAGIYSHYQVSIDPTDAQENMLIVPKATEQSGIAQAVFLSLEIDKERDKEGD